MTIAELEAFINGQITDNASGQVTASRVRQALLMLADGLADALALARAGVAGGVASAMPVLLGTGGPVDFAAAGPAEFMMAWTPFVFIPNVTSAASPRLSVTPLGGDPTGYFSIRARGGEALNAGLLQGGKPYLCLANLTLFTADVEPAAIANQYDVLHANGERILSIRQSGGAVSIWASSNGASAGLREVLHINAAGAARLVEGFYSEGSTPDVADRLYSRRFPQLAVRGVARHDEMKYAISSSVGPAESNEPHRRVVINTPLPHYLTIRDCFRGGVHVGGTTNARIDARFMPEGKETPITVGTGCTAEICIGAGARWRGQAPGDIMAHLGADSECRVMRIHSELFRLEVVAGAPTFDATPRWIAAVTAVDSGQSLHDLGFMGGAILDGVRVALKQNGVAVDINWTHCSYGGSALVEGNENYEEGDDDDANLVPDNYWVRKVHTDLVTLTDLPGPRALAWKAAIDAEIALGQPAPSIDLWNQGQRDAGKMAAVSDVGRSSYAEIASKLRALNDWKRVQYPGLKIGVTPLGSEHTLRDQKVTAARLAQLAAIRGDANAFQAADVYDLARSSAEDGTWHLTYGGQFQQGKRLGHDLARHIFGVATAPRAPFIDSVTEVADADAGERAWDVRIDTGFAGAGLEYLESPVEIEGLALKSPGDPMSWTDYPITRIKRDVDGDLWVLRLFAATAVTGARLVYPDGALAVAGGARRVLRQTGLTTANYPLQSYDSGP